MYINSLTGIVVLLSSFSQIMNSLTVIGFLLVLVLGTKCANATPIMQDTTASSIIIKNSSDENQMENLLYNTADTAISSDHNDTSNQPIIEKSTVKPHNERPAQRKRRRPRHRKNSVNHADCRTATERPPTTTKPTKLYVEFPGIFISHGWGPGR